jgi:hypothetical protein
MPHQPTAPPMPPDPRNSPSSSTPGLPPLPRPEPIPLRGSLWVREQLLLVGLAEGEVDATLDAIPTGISRLLPAVTVDPMTQGRFPKCGLGLSGEIGCGKTSALAALLVATLTVVSKLPECPRVIRGVAWACWPVETACCGSLDRMRDRVEYLANVPLLVLDDLGRERLKGSYGDDWSRANLDAIVTQRNRRRLPILWTTNCTFEELLGVYGPGMVSRLSEINPLIRLPKLRNLRVV